MELIDINSLNVKEYSKQHKEAFETWLEGEPIKSWYDTDNILCIEYESGNWWHYQKNNNALEWW